MTGAGELLTGAEVIAVGRRLVAAIESAMMQTDPIRESFTLLALRIERAEALELLKQTEARVRTLKRAGAVPGTRLHAKWTASFGG
jgi:hypothetical protein